MSTRNLHKWEIALKVVREFMIPAIVFMSLFLSADSSALAAGNPVKLPDMHGPDPTLLHHRLNAIDSVGGPECLGQALPDALIS